MMEADHSVAMAIGGATILMILITIYQHNGRAQVFDKQFTLDDFDSKNPSSGKDKSESSGGATLAELYEKLDSAGSFERELNGSLTKDAFMKLRKMVMMHVSSEFKPKKEELML